MAEADVQVTIGADASGVASGAAAAGAAIQMLVTTVDTAAKSFAALKTAVDAAFKGPAANGLAQAIKNTNDAGAEAQKAADQFEKTWSRATNSVVGKFTGGVLQMAEGSKNFGQVMRGVGQQILNEYISNVVNPMIVGWLRKETMQTAATLMGVTQRNTAETMGAAQSTAASGAGAAKTVVNDAAKAFSGAYSALVGIPIIGPVIAPPAAAAAAAAVLVVRGTIASAAGGYDIPAGLNPLAQLHAQEMVLPATLANPMRSLLTNYAGANGGDAASAGDSHVHNWTVNAVDAASVKALLSQHGDTLMNVLNGKLRGGARLATD
jgi:hypothetical protein